MQRLTPAKVTLLMLITVGGLITAYISKELLALDASAPIVERRNIPMAIADLKPGTVITESHIGDGQIGVDEIQPGTLLSSTALVGRVVKVTVPAATTVLSSQLYPPGERPPLSVSKGMRAVAVELADTASLVSGQVAPGQHVDVHMTVADRSNDRDSLGGGMTLTLFRGVKVLSIATANSQSRVDRAARTAVIELTPEQANIMILARERGKITMVYNPDGERAGGIKVRSADRTTFDEILGLRPSEPTNAFATQGYRGTTRSTNHFRNGRRDFDQSNDAATQSGPISNNLDSPGDAVSQPLDTASSPVRQQPPVSRRVHRRR